MAKTDNKTKTIVLGVVVIVMLAIIAGLIYCMITGVFTKGAGNGSEPAPTALKDNTAVTFTGAEGASEIYVNTDKTVYAQLASDLEGADNDGYMFVLTNKSITESMTEDEISASILLIARFVKSEGGYVLLFESLIDNFGVEQDVDVYDTSKAEFCSDTSVIVGSDGKLTMPADLKNGGLTDTLYCYMPGTCGISEADTISQEYVTRIFATSPFTAQA